MALSLDLVDQLREALRAFRAHHGDSAIPGGSGKALEAWLLMKLAAEARETGDWSVTLCQGDGTPLPRGAPFLFRNQPGAIGPAKPTQPGFVRLEHIRQPNQNTRLELHGSLQWIGRSGASHEWDVSVLPAQICEALRAGGGGYPSGLPVAAYECKDKTSPGTPDEMRQTLARLFDLAFVSQTSIGGNARIFESKNLARWGRRSSRYRSFFALGAFGIARVASFQKGASKIGDHFQIDRYWDIYKSNSPSVSHLLSRFREILANIHELL
jgi:hypothetical protein